MPSALSIVLPFVELHAHKIWWSNFFLGWYLVVCAPTSSSKVFPFLFFNPKPLSSYVHLEMVSTNVLLAFLFLLLLLKIRGILNYPYFGKKFCV